MSKNVLIFGLGFQGTKYVNYFNGNGYIIDGVTLSGNNKNNLLGLNDIFSYNDYIDSDFNKKDYELIIICVSPHTETEKIINYFLEKNYSGKILIEKPITYNLSLLNKLKEKINYYYFIDDIILSSIYKKINILDISIFSNDEIDTLEHVLGGFLLFNNFKYILNVFKLITNNVDHNNLIYSIILNKKINLNFYKGIIKLNNKHIMDLNFGKSLEFILGFEVADNLIYKENFIYLREYLNNYKHENK